MKKIILSLAALCCIVPLFGQASINYFPDSIIGVYCSSHGSDEYKTRVTKCDDGSYQAQVIWTNGAVDPATGQKYLDTKNPDKSLRNTPRDQVVIITGLKYNEEKKRWDGGKIYDPERGIKVNCNAFFEPDGRLSIKGKVMGVGEKIFWKRVEE